MELLKIALSDSQTMYRDLYEIGIVEECSLKSFEPLTSAVFWCYRRSASVKHFKSMLASRDSSRPLSTLLEKVKKNILYKFQALHRISNKTVVGILYCAIGFVFQSHIYERTGFLPHIAEFQTILYKHINFKLDKSVARQTSLQSVIDTLPQGWFSSFHCY